jgi:hypothetical protein
MTTATYNRRVGKTGRPLGLIDVLSKIIETAGDSLHAWSAARREAQLERERAAARRNTQTEANAVRRLADTWRTSSPGFAGDLYAAADQHELRHGH